MANYEIMKGTFLTDIIVNLERKITHRITLRHKRIDVKSNIYM